MYLRISLRIPAAPIVQVAVESGRVEAGTAERIRYKNP
jgi:hypothetical protein